MNQITKTLEAYYGREIHIEWHELELAQRVGAQVSRAMQDITRAVMTTSEIHGRRLLEAIHLAKRATAEQWQPDYTVTNTPPPLPNWRIQCRKQPNGRWHIRWPQGELIADAAQYDGALAIIRAIHERATR